MTSIVFRASIIFTSARFAFHSHIRRVLSATSLPSASNMSVFVSLSRLASLACRYDTIFSCHSSCWRVASPFCPAWSSGSTMSSSAAFSRSRRRRVTIPRLSGGSRSAATSGGRRRGRDAVSRRQKGLRQVGRGWR